MRNSDLFAALQKINNNVDVVIAKDDDGVGFYDVSNVEARYFTTDGELVDPSDITDDVNHPTKIYFGDLTLKAVIWP